MDEKTIGSIAIFVGAAMAAFEAWQKGRAKTLASSKAEVAAHEAASNPTPIPQIRPGDDLTKVVGVLIDVLNEERRERAEDRHRFQIHYQKITDELNIERNTMIALRESMDKMNSDNKRQAIDIADLRTANAKLIEVNAQLRASNSDLIAANDRLVAVNDEYRDMLASAGIPVSSINGQVQSQERKPNE